MTRKLVSLPNHQNFTGSNYLVHLHTGRIWQCRSRRFKTSKSVHYNTKEVELKNRAITNLWPPLKASRMKVQGPFGAAFITVGLPCIFEEAMILVALDPINGPRP
ncbi:hypothetical protein O181_127543 [Austropuccinia psidii MF-1]|uniref:Uncharacterized protein n=1 Tax=Austropuccinia psidii MF-1 TaxID=1389203 RepID=A0A9Q3KUL7_9BASI|nr:hypothetical protein [Austropuccinia psidii MF-1]